MRQALLVIVLVGAAFGGGALVSGPGFRFAQEHLLDYMGLQDGGEIDALDLAPPPDASPSGPLAGPAAVAASTPRPQPETPAPAPPSPPAPAPQPTEPFAETQAAQAAPTPAPAPAPAPEPAKAEPPALLGALSAMLPQAPAPAPAPAPGSAPAGSTRPAPESPAPLDPGVAPSALATPEPAPTPTPAPSAPATGGDWGEVRRKLAAAGVGRYTIEGEPGGRVVFACLIPVAGKQAVSQRFEAEGADEFQAAQAVLKRINLWRASHPTPQSP